jgi:hypothetical protein
MNCTSYDINVELKKISGSYVQVNDSLWFFKYPDSFDGNPLPKDEHLFYDHFEKFTNENSVIFIEVLRNDHYYNLPDEVSSFLESD